ncbi:hypothetical protein ACOMHN_061289 [Nucella lapillus]
MVTRRFLRLALLGLLAFMLFCLVVMELTLHGNTWVRARFLPHNVVPQQGLAYHFPPTRLTSTPPWRNPTLRRITANVTTSPSSSWTMSVQKLIRNSASSSSANTNSSIVRISNSTYMVMNSTTVPRNRGAVTHPSNNTTAVSFSDTTMASLSDTTASFFNAASDVNHCVGHGRKNSSEVFNLHIQKLPDGSRPVNCSKCFHSRFPPLLQSCGVCNTRGGGKVEVIMMILTTHDAVEKRDAIRHTWASVTRNNTAHVRHVFVLGRSKSEAHMQQVRKEGEVYGDVIMYDFVDSYANLTLKTLTILHWVMDYCHNARFMMKTDDDMWVNVPSLLETVKREASSLQTSIGGACHMSAGPIRNTFSKWYASKKAYPQNSYPGFCSGTGYVTSVKVVGPVLSVSPDVPFFYLEDVYLALCIQRLGPPFRLKALGGFVHGGDDPCVLRGKETVTVHQVGPQTLRRIWAAKCP